MLVLEVSPESAGIGRPCQLDNLATLRYPLLSKAFPLTLRFLKDRWRAFPSQGCRDTLNFPSLLTWLAGRFPEPRESTVGWRILASCFHAEQPSEGLATKGAT